MLIEIDELNELLNQGFSFRQICQTKNLKRSTLQGQLKKSGYVFKDNQYIKEDFDSGCTDIGTKNEPYVSTLDGRIDSIKVLLSNMTYDFCHIAFELYRINRDKEFELKGYSSLLEFTKVEFKLNRNNTYNFLRIAEQFLDVNGTYFTMKEEYKDYNFSQLVEVLSLPEETRNEISPTMTVKEIREKKKQVKENKEDKENIEQIPGQQIFVEASFNSVDEVKDFSDKIDLSLSISILEVAWSNEVDDNKANQLRSQIDYIKSLSK